MKWKAVFAAVVLVTFIPAVYATQYVTHHIVWGETLRKIAKKYYGEERQFPPIVRLNNIQNPDLIFAGEYLKIRLMTTVPEINPAVEPAKVPETARPEVPLTAVSPVPPTLAAELAPVKSAKWHGWRIGGMYGGGGGLGQGGTDVRVGPVVLNVSAGIGLGQNYIMANLQLNKEFLLPGDCRLGLSGIYANYSKYIVNVPWINGQVLNKGDNFGLGIYVSKDIDKWEFKVGYSPILGPNLGVSRYL